MHGCLLLPGVTATHAIQHPLSVCLVITNRCLPLLKVPYLQICSRVQRPWLRRLPPKMLSRCVGDNGSDLAIGAFMACVRHLPKFVRCQQWEAQHRQQLPRGDHSVNTKIYICRDIIFSTRIYWFGWGLTSRSTWIMFSKHWDYLWRSKVIP